MFLHLIFAVLLQKMQFGFNLLYQASHRLASRVSHCICR